MNKQSISYLRAYINKYPTLDNLRYITKILNYLYYEFPDIRQIPDFRTLITIDEYLEVFNNNLDLYRIKDIDNFEKVDNIDVRFSYNKDSYIFQYLLSFAFQINPKVSNLNPNFYRLPPHQGR